MASRLDTAASAAGSSTTYTVGTGSNRVLIVGVTGEGSTGTAPTCTYGGQSMTRVVTLEINPGTTSQRVSIFWLDETDIGNASGTTISVSNGGTQVTIHAASYQDCDQSVPTNYDSASTTSSTPNPIVDCDITTSGANSVVVAVAGCGNDTTASWANVTEQTEQGAGSTAAGSLADAVEATASTNYSCDCTWTSQNRAVTCALEIENYAGAEPTHRIYLSLPSVFDTAKIVLRGHRHGEIGRGSGDNWLDESGEGNDMTPQSSATFSTDHWVFTGSSGEYLTAGDVDAFDGTDIDMTMLAIFSADTLTQGFTSIFAKRGGAASSANGHGLYINDDDVTVQAGDNTNNAEDTILAALTATEITAIALRKDDSAPTLEAYVAAPYTSSLTGSGSPDTQAIGGFGTTGALKTSSSYNDAAHFLDGNIYALAGWPSELVSVSDLETAISALMGEISGNTVTPTGALTLKVKKNTAPAYLSTPGTSYGFAYASGYNWETNPSSIEMMARISPDDWTSAQAIIGADNTHRSFQLTADGKLFVNLYGDLGPFYNATSSVAVPTDSKWVRVVWSLSSDTQDFYTSTDETLDYTAVSWSSLGSQQTTTISENLSTVGNFIVGMENQVTNLPFTGKIYVAVLKESGNTDLVLNFWDNPGLDPGDTFTESGPDAETVTIHVSGTAEIVAEPDGLRGSTTPTGSLSTQTIAPTTYRLYLSLPDILETAVGVYRGHRHAEAGSGSSDNWVNEIGFDSDHDLVPEASATFTTDHWVFTDAANERLQHAADEAGFDIGTGDATILGVADHHTSGGGNRHILSKEEGGGTNGYALAVTGSADDVGAGRYATQNAYDVSNGDPAAGDIFAIAGVHTDSADEMEAFYADDSDWVFTGSGSPPTSTGDASGTGIFTIGASGQNSELHYGNVYAVAVWVGDALTTTELKTAAQGLMGEISGNTVTPTGALSTVYIPGTTTYYETATGATTPTSTLTLTVKHPMGQWLPNGDASFGDNTHMTGFVYDGTEGHDANGSFKVTSGSTIKFYDTYFAIPSYDSTVDFSYWIKSDGLEAGQHHYGFHADYDVDKLFISSYMVLFSTGSETTLAADLNTNDTTITLTDSSNWYTGSQSVWRGISFYPYKDGHGHTFEDYGYTRNVKDNNVWAEGGITGNVITLVSAWNYPNPDHPDGTWPAGTKVANSRHGGGYPYFAGANALTTSTWTKYSGTATGVSPKGTSPAANFRRGTRYVRFGWLLNRDGDGDEVSWIDDMEASFLPAANVTTPTGTLTLKALHTPTGTTTPTGTLTLKALHTPTGTTTPTGTLTLKGLHTPTGTTTPTGVLTLKATLHPTHTTDALLVKQGTTTTETDAHLVDRITETVTTDANLSATSLPIIVDVPATDPGTDAGHRVHVRTRKVNAGDSSTLFVELREHAIVIESWTIDPTTTWTTYEQYIDKTNAANISNYANLKIAFTFFYSGDPTDHQVSWVALDLPETHLSDAHLVTRQSEDHNADAHIVERSTDDHDADALIVERNTTSATADAHLVARLVDDHSTDAHLIERFANDYTTDAHLVKQGVITVSADAHLVGRFVDDYTTDANIARTSTTAVMDTPVTDPGINTGHFVHVRARKVNAGDTSFLTVELREDDGTQHGTDIQEWVIEPTTTWTTYVLPVDVANAATIDDYSELQVALTFYFSGNGADHQVSWVQVEVPAPVHIVDYQADARIGIPITIGHIADAIATGQHANDHDTDAIIKITYSNDHVADALLVVEGTSTYELDAHLVARSGGGHLTDTHLVNRSTLTTSTDAILRATETINYNADTIVVNQTSDTHDVDAVLVVRQTSDHELDAHIVARPTATHATDSHVVERLISDVAVDAILVGVGATTSSNDTVVVDRYANDFTTDAYLVTTSATAIIDIPSVDPGVDTGHFLHVRARKIQAGDYSKLVVGLRQNGTLIEQFTVFPTTTWATYTEPIDEANAATITDYSELEVWLTFYYTGSGSDHQVSWVNLELPDHDLIVDHETDAHIVIVTEPATHIADAILQGQATQQHDTDAILVNHASVDYDNDAYLVDRYITDQNTDAHLVEQATATHATDAVVVSRLATTHTTDAYVVSEGGTTHSTDAIPAYKSTTAIIDIPSADPGIDTGHFLHVRTRKVNASDYSLLKVELREDGVLIESYFIDPTDTWTTYTHALDQSNIATIGDYAELEVWLTFYYSGTAADHQVSWVNLELPTPTFVADHETDALIVHRHDPVGYIADAWLIGRDTKTHETDAILVGRTDTDHDVDANLVYRTAPAYELDAIVVDQYGNDFTLDATLINRGAPSHEIDAILFGTSVIDVDVDVIVVDQQTVDHATTSILRATKTTAHATDASLLGTQLLGHDADALLVAKETSTHSADGVLRETKAVGHEVTAGLIGQSTLQHTTDAAVSITLTTEHTTDAHLVEQATTGHNTEAILFGSTALTQNTDAVLVGRQTAEHDVDAVLQTTEQVDHATDVVLRATEVDTQLFDALLVKQGVATHSAHAGLFGTSTLDTTTNAHLVDRSTLETSTDALLRATETRTHGTTAEIRIRTTVEAQNDAVLRATEVTSHDVNAVLRATETVASDTDAVLRATETVNFNTYAFISDPLGPGPDGWAEHGVEAVLRATETIEHGADAELDARLKPRWGILGI